MAGGEITKTLPYSPVPRSRGRVSAGIFLRLTVSVAPELHERQSLAGTGTRSRVGLGPDLHFPMPSRSVKFALLNFVIS